MKDETKSTATPVTSYAELFRGNGVLIAGLLEELTVSARRVTSATELLDAAIAAATGQQSGEDNTESWESVGNARSVARAQRDSWERRTFEFRRTLRDLEEAVDHMSLRFSEWVADPAPVDDRAS